MEGFQLFWVVALEIFLTWKLLILSNYMKAFKVRENPTSAPT